MLTLKNISSYSPEYYELMPTCLYLKTEDGLDWYYHRLNFKPETLKVCYGSDNIIRMASYNAEYICPPAGCSVSEVAPDNVPDGFNDLGGWMFDGSHIIERVYSEAELIATAEKARSELIAAARSVINEWQVELALGLISDEDKSKLVEWLSYIKKVKSLDLTIATGVKEYEKINWPEKPN